MSWSVLKKLEKNVKRGFKDLGNGVKDVITSPLGAFALGGTAGLAALGAYNSVKASGQQAAQYQGYPQMAQQCCQQFLGHPMSMGGRGGITAFAGAAANARSHHELTYLAQAATALPAWNHPVGRANISQIIAANQARLSFTNLAFSYA